MKWDTNSIVISKITGFHTHQNGEIRVIKYLAGRDSEDRILI